MCWRMGSRWGGSSPKVALSRCTTRTAGSTGPITLSLSMTLSAKAHDNRVVSRYLWNLLPDNGDIIRAWAQNFDVGKNPFALLSLAARRATGLAFRGRVSSTPSRTTYASGSNRPARTGSRRRR